MNITRLISPSLPVEAISPYVDAVGHAVLINGHPYELMLLEPNEDGTWRLEADLLTLIVGGPFDGRITPLVHTARLLIEMPDDYFAGYDRVAEGCYAFDCLYPAEDIAGARG